MSNEIRRTALVTGAGQGIGRAIARRLSNDGINVICMDVNASAAEAVANEVGGSAETTDVTDRDALDLLASRTDRLDILVNNAGVFPPGRIDEVEAETFRSVMDVNVLGPLNTMQAFLPHLSKTRGAVVNIASMAAKLPTPGTGAYSPSKAAVVALTKLCAVELADRQVRFNAIAPGGVTTEGTASVSADPEREARFNALIPLGRRATPEDIADVVPFLVGEDSRYVTGQVIYVDGGLTEATVPFLQAAQRGLETAQGR